MTHLSEERDIPASPERIWRIVGDTKRWPQFYATPKEMGRIVAVEFLEGAKADGEGVKRRLHFTGLPAWDEVATKYKPAETLVWTGIRNPWQEYWTQQIDLIPSRSGPTTLRWDVFYKLKAPGLAKKAFKHGMEELILASLARVEKLVLAEPSG